MTVGSRKGGAFERKCGRLLSSWLTDGESDSELIRSVSSGGWARRKIRQVGDLAPNGPAGERFRMVYGVECKNRQQFSWYHLWTSSKPALIEWWAKHERECSEAGLVPIMMYTRNHQPLWLVYPAGLSSGRWGEWSVQLEIVHSGYRLTVVAWDEFSVATDPDEALAFGRELLVA